jgi:hypothetical protein
MLEDVKKKKKRNKRKKNHNIGSDQAVASNISNFIATKSAALSSASGLNALIS